MKKNTLINVIDEEFGDEYPLSWLVDVFYKAFIKNDTKVKICTEEYEESAKLVDNTLSVLYDRLITSEKNTANIVSVPRPRKDKSKG